MEGTDTLFWHRVRFLPFFFLLLCYFLAIFLLYSQLCSGSPIVVYVLRYHPPHSESHYKESYRPTCRSSHFPFSNGLAWFSPYVPDRNHRTKRSGIFRYICVLALAFDVDFPISNGPTRHERTDERDAGQRAPLLLTSSKSRQNASRHQPNRLCDESVSWVGCGQMRILCCRRRRLGGSLIPKAL